MKCQIICPTSGTFPKKLRNFQCNLPRDNTRTDTWEQFYTQGLQRMLDLEEESQGPSEKLQEHTVLVPEGHSSTSSTTRDQRPQDRAVPRSGSLLVWKHLIANKPLI